MTNNVTLFEVIKLINFAMIMFSRKFYFLYLNLLVVDFSISH